MSEHAIDHKVMRRRSLDVSGRASPSVKMTGLEPGSAKAKGVSMAYVYLLVAIVAEVIATSALKASDGFSRVGPVALVVAGYGIAFYMLSLTLRTIPVGIAYAMWSGLGIVLISIASRVLFGQKLDAPALIGMALIIAGVLVMNLWSKSSAH